MKLSVYILAVSLVFSAYSCAQDKPYEPNIEPSGEEITDQAPVLLISFDGFRHDYISKYETPNFDKFIIKGTSAEKMIPSFPSKTFPNHYTIVTGMYPGNHQLVDNTFYDPTREIVYTIGNRSLVQDAYYYGGTPLWQLLQEDGRKTASYFWVGSEAPIRGAFPTYYKMYSGSVANEERVNQVVDWFNMDIENRPCFVSLYFSFIDDAGHRYGPNSEEIKTAVEKADTLMGYIMDKLNTDVSQPINTIVVSDHGMIEMNNKVESHIITDDLLANLNQSDFKFISNTTHARLTIYDKADIDAIYQEILLYKDDRFEIYKTTELPEIYHYTNSDRVGDIVMIAKAPSFFSTREKMEYNQTRADSIWGTHGFDPYATEDMGAIFYANGPNVKEGLEINSFNNVHVYPFIAKILKISTPNNIDGDISVLEQVYKE
ncbi:MAG: alkaline phosphatase family protein [Flavobacteriaceae bacterium]|nr:alkaline phosphatase family protein [Flavobacteriaceae bacterium]